MFSESFQRWRKGRHHRRAERALERQLDYQTRKSALMRGAEEILAEHSNVDEAKALAKHSKRRHLGDFGKQIFFKNALYGVIAERT